MLKDNADFAKRLDEFLVQHADDDPLALRLRLINNSLPEDERDFLDFALLQLEARKKYALKMSGVSGILFPSMLACEQASNSEVAAFHATLVEDAGSLLDMSAGLGVDFIKMSKTISETGEGCAAIEIDENKSECLRLNLKRNGSDKAEVICDDAVEVLKRMSESGRKVDVIFIDPARRDSGGGRIYDPKKCEPDIVTNRDLLFEVAERVIIKNSPMLDISMAMKTFPDATDIYIISVRNECKEVLVDCRRGGTLERVVSVDILSDNSLQIIELHPDDIGSGYHKEFMSMEELNESVAKGNLYLYEPSVSQMKLGAWDFLASAFEMKKSSPNSHIFFSTSDIQNFPGRILKIVSVLDRKSVKGLKGCPRNVVTRNFPLKATPLSRKLKVHSGDNKFIYGLTISENEKPLLLDTVLV